MISALLSGWPAGDDITSSSTSFLNTWELDFSPEQTRTSTRNSLFQSDTEDSGQGRTARLVILNMDSTHTHLHGLSRFWILLAGTHSPNLPDLDFFLISPGFIECLPPFPLLCPPCPATWQGLAEASHDGPNTALLLATLPNKPSPEKKSQ